MDAVLARYPDTPVLPVSFTGHSTMSGTLVLNTLPLPHKRPTQLIGLCDQARLGALLIRNSLGSLVEDVVDVRGFEVAGDDVGLTLSTVEEPAGFGGEFGLVPGPVSAGKASFE
ncbi:hypothetical protein, partial [Streptomyces sp. NPDC048057]|uniref:hypothetical protein n=1 Tax=Streptomyces sp. NPDC048057 TaxID=3155628 RepID=UPI0033CA366E